MVSAAGLVVGVALAQLHAGAHHREQEGVAEHLQEVIVDLVVEAGEAAFVGARHLAEIEGGGVRIDDPRPGDKDAFLAGRHAVVVGADKLRALRDEDEAAGGGVIDVLAHLAQDLARQIAR